MDRIIIITHDKPRNVIETKKPPTLSQVQKWVGGFVQLIEISYEGKPAQLYCDEEAGIKTPRPPINTAATRLLMSKIHPPLIGPEGVLGNVVILQGKARWR